MFIHRMILPILAALCLLLSLPGQSTTFREGVDYTQVAGIPEIQTPIVREFFSYNCPHCYYQDSKITAMAALLGDEVLLERTPVGAGRPAWVLSQQAYYVANKLKISKQVHEQIFKQIHEKKAPFTQMAQLKAFFMAEGVTANEFDSAMASVDMKFALSGYDTQAEFSGIKGVPALLVNGRYLVSPGQLSAEQLAELVNYLIALPQ